jgi:long-chain-fatty-acid---luciferin-component ligase
MLSLPQMLGNVSKAYAQSPDDWARSVTDVLRDAAIYHQAGNGFYRAQCDAFGVDPAAINDINDLQALPLLPVGLFKRPDARVLLTCSLADVETETRSSGTRGVPSVAPRNSETLTLALVGLIGTYREFFSLSGGAGLFLNPSDPEASEMGLLKDLNILNSVFDHHTYLVADEAFDAGQALGELRRWKSHMTRHIVGPPFLIGQLLRFLEREEINLRLDPYSMIITLGGWKRHTDEAIPDERFRERCHDLLGVRAENVRDMYGLIESNMLAVECHLHRKHVPPWCYISIRDPGQDGDGAGLPRGELLAVLDALSTSYPGFLLTDDMGDVEAGTCGCGRTGQVINFRRRGPDGGLGHCPVSIGRYLGARTAVAEAPALVKA